MINLTVRNIPNEVIGKIKTLATLDRRSLNNELLVVIEKGLEGETKAHGDKLASISPAAQISIWHDLCGKWEDDRSTQEIKQELRASRTMGRKVCL
jgi:plasmid stability protein